MSDTPRTDIMASGNSDPSQDEYEEMCQWARRLERELNEERRLLAMKNDTANTFMAQVKKLQSLSNLMVEHLEFSCWQHKCSDGVGGCTAISESARLELIEKAEEQGIKVIK